MPTLLSEQVDISLCLALTDLILWSQLHVSISKITQHEDTIYNTGKCYTNQCWSLLLLELTLVLILEVVLLPSVCPGYSVFPDILSSSNIPS